MNNEYSRVLITAIDRIFYDGVTIGQGQVKWVSELDASRMCAQGRARRFNPPVMNPEPNGYIRREDRKHAR